MPVLNVSLSADQLAKRMQERLRGLSTAPGNTLLWRQQDNRVLIFVDSLKTRLLKGWLLANLDLQADETGRQTLQFLFYLGAEAQGDGLQAGSTVNAATPQAARLAEVWGVSIQRVLWDAALDALEAFVAQVAAQNPAVAVAIQGFQATPNGLAAVMFAGDK
jgi:hypothetical protein